LLLSKIRQYPADKLFGLVYAAFLTAAILQGYFFEFLVGWTGASYLAFLAAISSFFAYILLVKKVKFADTFHNYIALGSVFLLAISVPFWSGFHNVSLYFAIPIAYTVYLYAFSEIKKVALVILILSFFVAMYETSRGEFLFVSAYKGTQEILSEEEGYFFRAKGLMPGVLILGQFSILLSLLVPQKWWVPIFGFGCSMLAGSRSGMVAIPIIFLLRFKTNLSPKRLVLILILLIPVLIGIGSMIDPRTFDRLENIGNFDEADAGIDQSNIMRLYIWLAALAHYADYDIVHKIFGNNSSFFIKSGSNPESGWLALLTDTGLLGILFYLSVFVTLFIRCIIRRRWRNFVETAILFGGMIPYTLNLTREGSLLFWLIIFSIIDETSSRKDLPQSDP
jgi:hypothetical protein